MITSSRIYFTLGIFLWISSYWIEPFALACIYAAIGGSFIGWFADEIL